MMQRSLVAAAFLALSTSTGLASAAPNFPDQVQEVFGTSCVPSCLLCHSTNPGRKGTAFGGTRFGQAVAGKGIVGEVDDAVIKAALIKIRDGDPTAVPPVAPTNSDINPATNMPEDTLTDAQELAADTDPNVGNKELCEVTYGCGARVSPSTPNRRFAIFSSVAVALGLLGLTLRARRPY
jgi:hypothetical protein